MVALKASSFFALPTPRYPQGRSASRGLLPVFSGVLWTERTSQTGSSWEGASAGAFLGTKVPARTWDVRYIQMEADLYAQVAVSHFRANVSIGFLPQSGAFPAAITNNDNVNLISRQHWIGYEFGDQAFLLRAGRINVPFGLRIIEHTSFVRMATRTDINAYQQDGVALAYTGEKWRGELMAIVGNFQISPDAYHERGYSGYAELSLAHNAAVGVSSLLTYAKKDILLQVGDLRQAHGLFARYVPIKSLVLLAEGDLLAQSPSGAPAYVGYAGFLQADIEFIQGVHLFPMVEILDERTNGSGPSYGAWLSPDWFFAPHSDLRLDFYVRQEAELRATTTAVGFLTMLHFYL